MPASTPIYGFRYPLDTDPVPVMPSDMEALAEDVEATFDLSTGGKKIVPSASGHTNITFDARGNGTPSTGVSTFTVNNVFTTAFNRYHINWLGAVNSSGAQVRLSYVGITSGYYGGMISNRPNNSTPFAATTDNNNSFHNEQTYFFTTGGSFSVDIYNPAQAGVSTSVYSEFLEQTGTGTALGRYIGFVSSTASVASFTLAVSGGTLTTAGRVTIYGFTV